MNDSGRLAKLCEALRGVPEGAPGDLEYAKFRKTARETSARLGSLSRHRDEHLEISFVGYFRGGKSTLVNALLGSPVLPSRLDPTTQVPTRITFREQGYESRLVFVDQELLYREREELAFALKGRRRVDEMQRALASVGALRGGPTGVTVNQERVAQLTDALSRGGKLPSPSAAFLGLLGTTQTQQHAHLEEMLAATKRHIAPEPDKLKDTEFSLQEGAALAEVVLSGPFERLRALLPPNVDPARVSLLDTPGLGDREGLGRRVREALCDADIVCLNLSHNGNLGEEDDRLIRELIRSGTARHLVVTMGKFDLLHIGSGDGPAHLARTRRHINTVIRAELEQRGAGRPFEIDVPVIGVVPLASLARQLGGQTESELPRDQRRLVEDYPDDISTGIDELRAVLRGMLDPAHRRRHVAVLIQECVRRELLQCSAALAAAVSASRSSYDLSGVSHRELTTGLQSLEREFQPGSSTLRAESIFGLVRSYHNLRGKQPERRWMSGGQLCEFKCCDAPSTHHLSYRQIKHEACAVHWAVMATLHRQKVSQETAERPECMTQTCQNARIPGRQFCSSHVEPDCMEPGCRETAAVSGLCQWHWERACEEWNRAQETAQRYSAVDDRDDVETCGAETTRGTACSNPPDYPRKRCWHHVGRRKLWA